MVITFVLLLLVLVAFGGLAGLAVVALVAIAKNRPGIAAALGGVACLGILLTVGYVLAYLALAQTPRLPTLSGFMGSVPAVATGLSMFRGILIITVIAIIAAVLLRDSSGKAPSSVARWWPVLLIPFVLLFLLSGVHVQTSNERSPKRIETAQRNIAQQRAATERRVAEIESRFKNTDIHKLMDKHDSPRIALAPRPPAAPEEPAAPTPSDGEAVSAAVSQAAPQEPTANDEAVESTAAAALESDAASEASDSSEAAPAAASVEDEKNDGTGASQADESAASDAADERGRGRPGSPDTAITAAPRPEWLDDPPKRVGNIWRHVIATDEFATREECDREADRLLLRATFDHIHVLAGRSDYGSPPRVVPATILDEMGQMLSDEHQSVAAYLARMGITIDFIRREIAKDEYLATHQRSFGPMMRLYTLVEFSPSVDRDLRERWSAYQRQARLHTVGLGAALVLGLLGMVWGLLKVDTLTKGYYSKRLFLGVPAAIISLLALLALAIS